MSRLAVRPVSLTQMQAFPAWWQALHTTRAQDDTEELSSKSAYQTQRLTGFGHGGPRSLGSDCLTLELGSFVKTVSHPATVPCRTATTYPQLCLSRRVAIRAERRFLRDPTKRWNPPLGLILRLEPCHLGHHDLRVSAMLTPL